MSKPSEEKPFAEGVAPGVEPETYRTPDVRDHLVEFDALRGIAILGVLIAHLVGQWKTYMGSVTMPVLDWELLDLIQIIPGVPLFYVLSGYLLAWTEGKRAERGSYSMRSYAMRRILRLVPAYYAAIVVVLLVWPTPVSLPDLLSHLTFLHGLTPAYARTMSPAFWSLTPEVVFYCLVPLIVLKLPGLRQRLVLFVALLAISIPTQLLALANLDMRPGRVNGDVAFAYGEFNPFSFFSSLPTAYLFLFAAGMFLKTLAERLNGRPASRLQSHVALALFLTSIIYVVVTKLALEAQDFKDLGLVAQLGLQVSTDLALICFFASAVLGAPVLRRLLKWRWLSFIGLISYSMFVFHQTVLMLVSRHILRNSQTQSWATGSDLTMLVSFLAYSLAVFLVVVAVSYLGFRYVESPFLRIKPK